MSGSESLRKRLGYLRSKNKSVHTEPLGKKKVNRFLPEGWTKVGSYVWERTAEELELTLPEIPAPSLFPFGRSSGLRFFDLETTGLSGGAGTVAFLAGVGILKDKRLSVRQVFLSDYPGEAEFLNVLIDLLPPEEGLVSYNGKGYDMNLLKTRCLMNRIVYTSSRSHTDLLYPSRTLFRRITGKCSLQVVENRILGIERIDDIPGALVPEFYFRYLDTGDPGSLDGVFRHNIQDIISLARLLQHILQMLNDPYSAEHVDPAGLGKLLIASESSDVADYLARAFNRGDPRAGKLLGLYLKKRGYLNDAVAVWTRLAEDHGDINGAVEKAKYLEHRRKQPAEALRLLRDIMERGDPDAATKEALEYRMRRLERKAAIGPASLRDTQ